MLNRIRELVRNLIRRKAGNVPTVRRVVINPMGTTYNELLQWADTSSTATTAIAGGNAGGGKNLKHKSFYTNYTKSMLEPSQQRDLPKLFQAYARKLMAEGGIEVPDWMDLSEMMGNWIGSNDWKRDRYFREDYTLVQEFLDDQWPIIVDAIKAGPPAQTPVSKEPKPALQGIDVDIEADEGPF